MQSRSRCLRRAARARAIRRALAKGPVPTRGEYIKVEWRLCALFEDAVFVPRVIRVRSAWAVGAVFVPRVAHRRDCPAVLAVREWTPSEFASIEEARARCARRSCDCPIEPWSRFRSTPKHCCWVAERVHVVRPRALAPARAAGDRLQFKRRGFDRAQKDSSLLWARWQKARRARALGSDWSFHDWDDEELSPESRSRKLPRRGRRYPR